MDDVGATEERPEASIVAAAVSSELPALGHAFDRHARSVFGYCYRRCGDIARAEDMTSTTFLEFWRSRERATLSEGSLLPWLLGIANNVIRSAERSERRLNHALSRMTEPPPQPDHAETVVEAERGRELAEELRRIVTGLKDDDRTLLSLSLYGELTMRQIADVVGVPEGTVKSRLSRLRARVERQMQHAKERAPA